MKARFVLIAVVLTACFGGNISPTGDIFGVTAGSGLTGGATSGEATLDVGSGSGITITANGIEIDPTYTQRRVTGTCSVGNAIRVIDQTGTVTCQAASGGAGITNSAGNNVVTKSDGTNVVASTITDNGTTVNTTAGFTIATNKFTVAAATGNTTIAGTLDVVGNLTENSVRVVTAAGTGISKSGGTLTLNMTAQTCGAGAYITSATATGVFGCASDANTTYTAGTNLTLATTTFNLNPTISLLGASNVSTITATNTATAQTSSVNVVRVNNAGATFNTTAGALVSTGISGSSTSTRSAGANTLTNIGVYGIASGGQANYSGYFDTGSFRVVGAAQLDSTLNVAAAAQFDTTLNATGNITENSARVITLPGTGLSKSGGTLTVNIAGASCSAGQHMSALGATGTGTCSADAGAPTAITASVTGVLNDWTPSGLSSATTNINITSSASGTEITGISSSGRSAGSTLRITNTGGNTVKFDNEVLSSTANQIMTINGAAQRSIGTYGGIDLVFNGTKWVETSEGSRYAPELYSLGALQADGASTLVGNVGHFGDTMLGDASTDKTTVTGNVYSVAQSPGVGKPVASSCGTSPSIQGGSHGFYITVGTGSPTSCTVTFATAFLDVPACTITRIGGTSQQWFQWSSLSGTAGTFQGCNSTACGGNTLTASYAVQCIGTSINAASP